MEISIIKNTTQTKFYNYEVLQKLLQEECGETESSEATETTQKNQSDKNEWRFLPPCDMDMMIISSYGDETCPSIDVAPKLQDNTTSTSERMSLVRTELDIIQDHSLSSETSHLAYVCFDFPGAQITKDYYIDRIKQFLQQCKEGATLWYTGHGERGTGNWCFKDGVITFDDIFGLYMNHFRGKRLTIISDCSYSGKWVRDCAKKLDEIDIPSCGHHTREQKILLKIFTACEENQEATISVLAKTTTVKDGKYMYFPGHGRQLDSGQKSCLGDFRSIRCRSKPSEPCDIKSLQMKWENRLFKGRFVYLVRGKDGVKPAWHFVLVDEDKLGDFKTKVATGTIDVADYGKVLCSGFGKDPPEEKKKMIDMQFAQYIWIMSK